MPHFPGLFLGTVFYGILYILVYIYIYILYFCLSNTHFINNLKLFLFNVEFGVSIIHHFAIKKSSILL